MDNRTEPKPTLAVDNKPALILDNDEQIQLAKFLDALLEADMTNKSNGRKRSNESVLSHSSGNNPQLEPVDQQSDLRSYHYL